jgi:hypothetical protein
MTTLFAALDVKTGAVIGQDAEVRLTRFLA